MKIYIDLFFLFNIMMDLIIILSVGLLLKRKIKIFRVIISCIIGGISSLFLFLKINIIFVEIITAIIISLTAFGYKRITYFIKNIIYMYFVSTLIGGVMYLFNLKVSTNILINYLIMIVISAEVMILYIKEMQKVKEIYNNNYLVDIYFKDNDKLSLVGFMDTGNNLYDPYKKRPIILVSSKYYREDNFILVPFSTVDSHGMLKCIKINGIYIDKKKCKREVLVAFCDNPILIDGVDVILHKDVMKG